MPCQHYHHCEKKHVCSRKPFFGWFMLLHRGAVTQEKCVEERVYCIPNILIPGYSRYIKHVLKFYVCSNIAAKKKKTQEMFNWINK